MNASSDPVSLALIGCGGIAQTHLEAIGRVPQVRLAAVCDTRADLAAAAAGKYGVPAVSSVDAILKDKEIRAILVCVPPAHHFDLMKKAVAAGKSVLCEKPFTLSVKEAETIRALSAAAGTLVMMASKFRFVQDVIEARKFIQSGTIGDLILSEVIFCSVVNMEGRWNSDARVAGGGVLIDNGSHAVDVIRYVVGPIRSVYAQAGKRTQNVRVEDTARLHFETDGGVIGMVDLSWSLYKHTPNYVNLFGTKGTVEVGWAQSLIWDAGEKTSRVFGNGYKKLDAFVNQIRHFADCIQKKTDPILGIEDAVESVRVIETAYRSISEKKWLKVRG
ncbi:MAG: Gfo/Idh/MocA family oxidoreductase [Candidatus Omnitrophica bacterium]|nr:Gfo/Idh/MocA family oxidoreductase [Candidatus Omnitrophota bacterium]